MPRNGAGVYTQPGGTAAVSNTTISSTAYNNLTSDIGNEITNSLPTTGVKAMGANLPMGSNRITGLADPVASSDAATKNYVATAAAPISAVNVFVGGTSTGSANAQVLATTVPNTFTLTAGNRVVFSPGFTNTGALTLAVNGLAAKNVFTPSGSGPVALIGGEIRAGQITEAIYDGTQFVLAAMNPDASFGPLTNLASAATTDLGTIASHNVNVTGTATITSFGSSASTAFPTYMLTFAGALTLTYNASSLILPGGANIITAAGDTAVALYLGSGNWRIISYASALDGIGTAVQGDMIYGSAANSWARLPKGTALQTLQMNAGATAPQWITVGQTATVQSASGTAITFTGIPSGVREISVMARGIHFVAASGSLLTRIGPAGGLVTTGYEGGFGLFQGASNTFNTTNGFTSGSTASTSNNIYFFGKLSLVDPANNVWGFFGNAYNNNSNAFVITSAIALSGPLTQVGFLEQGGGTFAAGILNIAWSM